MKRLGQFGLLLGAVTLQIHGLLELVHAPTLGQFALGQIACAGLFSVGYTWVFPAALGWPRWDGMVHVFLACCFMPVLGPLLFPLELLVQRWTSPPAPESERVEVGRPQFDHLLIAHAAPPATSFLAKLDHEASSASLKTSALLTLRAIPLRYSSPLLAGLVLDKDDEVRLLATGTLDRAEKALMKDIYAAIDELQPEPLAPAARLPQRQILARLAELYWEVIYQNLVRGDMYNHVLSRVEHFGRRALELEPGLGGKWYLLARCALLQQRPEAALEFLNLAQSHHFPLERLAPWFAEVAFVQQRYGQIPLLLHQMGVGARLPTMLPLVKYWNS